jgi:hypothetical protein
MPLRLNHDVAAQIRGALVAALHATGGGFEEDDGPGAGRKTRDQEAQLREAITLLESAALDGALLATPLHALANLEAVLGLALACARNRICTDPSKIEYDGNQAQALELLEKFHADVRQSMSSLTAPSAVRQHERE